MHLNHFKIEWLKIKMLQNIIQSRMHFLKVSQVKKNLNMRLWFSHGSLKKGGGYPIARHHLFLIPVSNVGSMPK